MTMASRGPLTIPVSVNAVLQPGASCAGQSRWLSPDVDHCSTGEGKEPSSYEGLCMLSLGTKSLASMLRDTECAPGSQRVGNTGELQAQQPQ